MWSDLAEAEYCRKLQDTEDALVLEVTRPFGEEEAAAMKEAMQTEGEALQDSDDAGGETVAGIQWGPSAWVANARAWMQTGA